MDISTAYPQMYGLPLIGNIMALFRLIHHRIVCHIVAISQAVYRLHIFSISSCHSGLFRRTQPWKIRLATATNYRVINAVRNIVVGSRKILRFD